MSEWLRMVWAQPGKRSLLCAAVLALLSFVQYANSLDNDFVWDARETFLTDPSIRDFKYLPGFFTESAFAHQAEEGNKFAHLAYYRPLLKALHLLEFSLFGENPRGYNAVNIVLNMAVVVAAFFLVQVFTGKPLTALLASLIYAFNPTRVEAVSWSYSDSYMLFSLLCLLALWAFHRHRYGWSLTAYAVALFVQESAVLLPLVLVLHVWLIQRGRGVRAFVPVLPFIAMTVAFLLIRSAAVGTTPLTSLGLPALANAAATILTAAVKAFFVPEAGISIYHYTPGMFDAFSAPIAVAYVVTAALLVLGWWLWRSGRHAVLFWYLWFFVWMAVIFNVGKYAEYYFMDKILYLGSLGFSVLLAQLALAGPWRRGVGIGVVGALLLAHFGVTLWRTGFYTDEGAYFEEAAQVAPDFALVQYSLATYYVDKEEYEKALAQLRKTVAIDPRHSFAQNNLGNLYFMRNQYSQAISAWQAAIASDPANPQPYYNVGMTYERQGEMRLALDYYRQYLARERQPDPRIQAYIQRLQ
jgi:tetratricopeptide (TPR) repeat protein